MHYLQNCGGQGQFSLWSLLDFSHLFGWLGYQDCEFHVPFGDWHVGCHQLPYHARTVCFFLLAHLLAAPPCPVSLRIVQGLDFCWLPLCVSLVFDLSFPIVIGFSQPWPSSYLPTLPSPLPRPSSATAVSFNHFPFLILFSLLFILTHGLLYVFAIFPVPGVRSGPLISRVITRQWIVWTGTWSKIHNTSCDFAVLPLNFLLIPWSRIEHYYGQYHMVSARGKKTPKL